MKDIKVAFLSWHYTSPQVFLDKALRKMTPNRSGRWKNIVATTDVNEADYYVVFDGYSGAMPDQDKKGIFVCQHPKVQSHSPAFKTYDNVPHLLAIRLDKHLNMGEWWIDQDYDTLSSMGSGSVHKKKDLGCVVTYQQHQQMYRDRITFMENLFKQQGDCDLYGRPEELFRANPILSPHYLGSLGNKALEGMECQHMTGKEIIQQYRYTLEFDVGPTTNYLSERFYDAMLLWSMPIYFGSTNAHEFLPENSFLTIGDMTNKDEVESIIEVAKTDHRERHLKDMKVARDLLLNNYQAWAYTHNILNNLDYYLNGGTIDVSM